MNTMSQEVTAQVRKVLTAMLIFGAMYANAQQTNATPHFQVNFQSADSKQHDFSFRQEAQSAELFDLVVLKDNEEVFRFTEIQRNTENVYTFTLVDDKFKALSGLNQQKTLTTHSNFATEILDAYEHNQVAMIGILECSTKVGATSRIQVAKLYSPDDEPSEEGLTVIEK